MVSLTANGQIMDYFEIYLPDARKVAVGGIILVLIGLPVRAIFTKKKAA